MKYKELKDFLIKCSNAYYKNSSQIISDYDFDLKLKELEKMEKEQGYSDSDSPTKKPGSDITENVSRKHNRPMLSLENTYNSEEVEDWYVKMQKIIGNNPEVITEYKYDGGSCAIRFKNGKIILALTRGDGEVGEDITENVKLLDWNNISEDFSGEVRGELIITKKGFLELNKDGKYANARNLLSGSMKLLDRNEFKKRAKYIKFFAYWFENDIFKNHYKNIEYLKKNGFETAMMICCKNYNDIEKAINKIENEKPNLEIDIDGAVMKINETKYWSVIGETSKFPKWAKAYKYNPEEAITIVKNIEFWCGQTGKITPVAILEPILLSGSTISKATLNNKEYMENLNIKIGDHVRIKKAAEIIPFIIGVCKEMRTGKETLVKFPKECPICGSKLKKISEEQADYYCQNENCPGRVRELISNYTHSLEIDGFADIIIDRLYLAGYLKSIKDLFLLENHIAEISNLDRLSKNLIKKLIGNIEKSKNNEFWKFISGIGIKNVGPKTAKILVEKFKNIDNLMNATKEELMSINDIGDIVADSIINYFSKNENIEFIKFMKEQGQNLKSEKESNNKLSLNDLSFCITGALSRPRSYYENEIEKYGGKIVGSVSKKTNYLVTNDTNTNSAKNKKAKELNINIINEEELLKLLK